MLKLYASVGTICKIYLPRKRKLLLLELNSNNGTIVLDSISIPILNATLNNDSTSFKNCDIGGGLITTNNSKEITITACSIKNLLSLTARNSKKINTETTIGDIDYDGNNSILNLINHHGSLSGNSVTGAIRIENEKLNKSINLSFSTSTINLKFKELSENVFVSSSLSGGGNFHGSLLRQKGCTINRNILDTFVTYNAHNQSTDTKVILNGSVSTVNFDVGPSITDYLRLN